MIGRRIFFKFANRLSRISKLSTLRPTNVPLVSKNNKFQKELKKVIDSVSKPESNHESSEAVEVILKALSVQKDPNLLIYAIEQLPSANIGDDVTNIILSTLRQDPNALRQFRHILSSAPNNRFQLTQKDILLNIKSCLEVKHHQEAFQWFLFSDQLKIPHSFEVYSKLVEHLASWDSWDRLMYVWNHLISRKLECSDNMVHNILTKASSSPLTRWRHVISLLGDLATVDGEGKKVFLRGNWMAAAFNVLVDANQIGQLAQVYHRISSATWLSSTADLCVVPLGIAAIAAKDGGFLWQVLRRNTQLKQKYAELAGQQPSPLRLRQADALSQLLAFCKEEQGFSDAVLMKFSSLLLEAVDVRLAQNQVAIAILWLLHHGQVDSAVRLWNVTTIRLKQGGATRAKGPETNEEEMKKDKEPEAKRDKKQEKGKKGQEAKEEGDPLQAFLGVFVRASRRAAKVKHYSAATYDLLQEFMVAIMSNDHEQTHKALVEEFSQSALQNAAGVPLPRPLNLLDLLPIDIQWTSAMASQFASLLKLKHDTKSVALLLAKCMQQQVTLIESTVCAVLEALQEEGDHKLALELFDLYVTKLNVKKRQRFERSGKMLQCPGVYSLALKSLIHLERYSDVVRLLNDDIVRSGYLPSMRMYGVGVQALLNSGQYKLGASMFRGIEDVIVSLVVESSLEIRKGLSREQEYQMNQGLLELYSAQNLVHNALKCCARGRLGKDAIIIMSQREGIFKKGLRRIENTAMHRDLELVLIAQANRDDIKLLSPFLQSLKHFNHPMISPRRLLAVALSVAVDMEDLGVFEEILLYAANYGVVLNEELTDSIVKIVERELDGSVDSVLEFLGRLDEYRQSS